MGFAEKSGPITDKVEEAIYTRSVGTASSAIEMGRTDKHVEVESLVANFLGVEDCITFGMGYATNSGGIPALIGPGSLVISDSKNHSSLCLGCRLSDANIKVFKHNG